MEKSSTKQASKKKDRQSRVSERMRNARKKCSFKAKKKKKKMAKINGNSVFAQTIGKLIIHTYIGSSKPTGNTSRLVILCGVFVKLYGTDVMHLKLTNSLLVGVSIITLW